MIAHEIPTTPWSQVGADLFEINTKKYLVMVDYYSGFIDCPKTAPPASKSLHTVNCNSPGIESLTN